VLGRPPMRINVLPFAWCVVLLALGCSSPDGAGSDAGGVPPAACPLDDAGTILVGMFGTSDANCPCTIVGGISDVTADDDAVYVVMQSDDFSMKTSTNTVLRVASCGGPATVLGTVQVPMLNSSIYNAIVASGRVFLVSAAAVYSVPTTGGPIVTETTSTTYNNQFAGATITVAGDQLYWIDGAPSLWAVTIGGGHTPRLLASAPSSQPATWTSIAADDTNAYVTAIPSAEDAGTPSAAAMSMGSILAIPLAGGPISSLATGQPNPGDMIVANGSLYWISYMPGPQEVDTPTGTGSIYSLRLPDGAPVGVALDEGPVPSQLLMVGTTLYWANGDEGDDVATVRKEPANQPPATVATLGIAVDGLTLAGRGAYWVTAPNQVLGVSLEP
jgi:hypothetical protein